MKHFNLLIIALLISVAALSQNSSSSTEARISVGIADYIGKTNIPLAALSKADGLTVEVNDKRGSLEIIGFTVLIKGKVAYMENITGATFSDVLKEHFKTLKPGVKLQFKDVKVKGLDGKVKTKAFVYTITK